MRRLLPVLALSLVVSTGLGSCTKDASDSVDTDSDTPSPLLDVASTATWAIPGLESEAYIAFTAMGVPYVYATSKADLGRVVGFQLARDRFFYMDLASRLALGQVAQLLGSEGLSSDLEQRGLAATWIADRVLGLVDADPDMAAYFDGVAAGVNAYIDQVIAGTLPPPEEYVKFAPFLGGVAPSALLERWDRRRVVGGVVTVLYQSGFETKDVGRARDAKLLEHLFDGDPEQDLRTAELLDAWGRAEPVFALAQAPGWAASHPATAAAVHRPSHVPVQLDVLERLHEHTQRTEARLGHDWEHGFGSNAWVVAGSKTADGRTLVATDGHLSLSVPPLFYQIGIDTEHLGGGDIHQVGMMTPAMPLISTGTNGHLAFGQTQLIGDITDWYSEELVLDGDGLPTASRFDGGERDLVAVEERIEIGDVPPPLGSGAGTFTFTRYTTFDGRWITSIEGDALADPEDAPEGQGAVMLLGDWVSPRDVDGDGVISAVSFDYAGLDLSTMPVVIDAYAKADSIDAFAEATHDLVAYSLNLVVGDDQGDIYYSGYQATPCRDYLERDGDGVWTEGSDPNLLLDGTRYGGFTIPIVGGKVSFDDGGDPYKCVVPYDEYPHERNPDRGFLVSANNDPGGLTFDGSLTNDPRYIGGPWMEGYRAAEITSRLNDATADSGATLDDMKAIQADHHSGIGEQLTPVLLDAIDTIRGWAEGKVVGGTSEARSVAMYQADTARIGEAYDRLSTWAGRGYLAESGVETFYDHPTDDMRTDAVATSIFNAWMGRYTDYTVDDEGIPGLGWPTGDSGRFRLLSRMLAGRGVLNATPGWNPDTQESIFFDIKSTPELERSEEVAIRALVEALDYLTSDPTGPGVGGYGTDDMDAWLWGLRHTTKMSSLVGEFLDTDNAVFASLLKPFNITPEVLPLAEGMASDDPRKDLPGFPRHSDNLCVDAANSGTNGLTYSNGSGSVWRLVVALGGDGGFEAYNVIPGGQSGLPDSPHFADQATLWLANEYLPVYLDVADVAGHAEYRETFTP
ncbi:MAG: penicillin acylase family protein [Alphaproteobacteria bacterium]|nr:penicillin acylase family protein [Alphaproteobacteria bacterium]